MDDPLLISDHEDPASRAHQELLELCAHEEQEAKFHEPGQGLGGWLGKIGQLIQTSKELLTDAELRKRAMPVALDQGRSALQELQRGLADNVAGMVRSVKQSVAQNRRNLQAFMLGVEKTVADRRRQRALEEARRRVVDVQIGVRWLEGVPQEVRCRLWWALLEAPGLADAIRPIHGRVGPLQLGPSDGSWSARQARPASPASRALLGADRSSRSGFARSPRVSLSGAAAVKSLSRAGSMSGAASNQRGSLEASFVAASGHSGSDAAGAGTLAGARSTGSDTPADAGSAGGAAAGGGGSVTVPASGGSGRQGAIAGMFQRIAQAVEKVKDKEEGTGRRRPSEADGGTGTAYKEGGSARGGTTATPSARNTPNISTSPTPAPRDSLEYQPPQLPSITASHFERESAGGSFSRDRRVSSAGLGHSERTSRLQQGSGPQPATVTAQQVPQQREDSAGVMLAGDGDWELVSDAAVSPHRADALSAGGSGTTQADGEDAALRSLLWGLLAEPGPLAFGDVAALTPLLQAMVEVPWRRGHGPPPDHGLPTDYPPDCRFATLNEMTAGQEEIDDIITRDIHRTFPEHPLFGMEAGQRSLFRLLKAYSLHDLEVGYCQGMAFAAGVMLMYLPEEPAFRLYCRMMDPDGPNLRRLYTPGLDGLKAELAGFEALLAARQPALQLHLVENGIPPVLYASQWLMTVYATPFPPTFCAQLIDVMAQEGDDSVMMRVALAIMDECAPLLLPLGDFEALLTTLKVAPLQWGRRELHGVLHAALSMPLTHADIRAAVKAAEGHNHEIMAAAHQRRAHSRTASGHMHHMNRAGSTGAAAGSSGAVAAGGGAGAGGSGLADLLGIDSQSLQELVGGSSAAQGGISGITSGGGDLLGDEVPPAGSGSVGAGGAAAAPTASGGPGTPALPDLTAAQLAELELEDEYMALILDLGLVPGAGGAGAGAAGAQ
uniref:Rab-GAP TBC domain-containing protein n=1 Tax=Chlamydomonas leiostraca TaxID=1034604 RepID=A0A7S0RLM3_9CHLO|mmetsp:Transcript_25254/g.64180  ORF Transcript_25254/g.64180 Transcript_25254/m.64180 type:complete len:950 (+) Transcript_25254:94-2943(+)|eukprot:CAMPEP_0202857626 /NCGR_PEP_ID=MMETSP1391-20130828/493_1 /ASSEMBLY_ACC=CAM_ASM_000867 /TAXON_ID=1034604 /ORGANISM="Chlamydomonas leiostraca, Strain SAG 11-49" /LENGTH=949 /DNA_ID=CAMNT_0049536447 /DNA_START=72 /DNA_END=2921 /DNA_ORIENTATION=+